MVQIVRQPGHYDIIFLISCHATYSRQEAEGMRAFRARLSFSGKIIYTYIHADMIALAYIIRRRRLLTRAGIYVVIIRLLY